MMPCIKHRMQVIEYDKHTGLLYTDEFYCFLLYTFTFKLLRRGPARQDDNQNHYQNQIVLLA